MVINIKPELGVPLTKGIKQVNLPERVEALDNTVNKLVEDKPHLYEFLPQDIKDKLNDYIFF